jgi:hypothetical protein
MGRGSSNLSPTTSRAARRVLKLPMATRLMDLDRALILKNP